MHPPFPAHLFHAFLPACRVAGASTKNVRAAADYVKSFIPADVMKRQLENRASSGGASGGAPSRASRSPSQVVHMKVEAGALDDLQDGPARGTGPGPMASTAPATTRGFGQPFYYSIIKMSCSPAPPLFSIGRPRSSFHPIPP